MSELISKSYDVISEFVDLYRCICNNDTQNELSLRLVFLGKAIMDSVTEAERLKIPREFIPKLEEALENIDMGEVCIKLLLHTDSVSREQAEPALRECEALKKLIVLKKSSYEIY